ncbi:TlpA family protein disulfide reductase [Pedobacter sp. AW31-3R]|uniref:TlpA family protein disulfide reductase n=1 Tax=Pedobacter sp. AW31-3R TaxID=3445781 RepID=UPI003F9F6517
MKLKQVITSVLFFINFTTSAQSVNETPELGIGSQVSEYPNVTWLKGEAVSHFDKNKTYIIECWATWCGPCMGAIPHLNELHRKYKDQITIIGQGVMENDLTKVRKFVRAKGDEMSYAVAFAGGSNSDFAKKWLVPAGVKGIPQTFVIQNNQIVWTPSPVELTEEAIELLIGRKFSLENLKAAQKTSEINIAKDLLLSGKFEESLSILHQLILKNPDNGGALLMKYNVLEKMGRAEEAAAFLEARHQEKLHPEIFLSYYRSLNKRNEQDKLLQVLEADIDRCLADDNTLIADVIMEAYKTYYDRKDYPGLRAFIQRIIAKSTTSRPLFSVAAISQYYPIASPVEAKPVNAAVFTATMKLLEMSQMEFHYLIGSIKMFWNQNERKYAVKLVQSAISAAKRDKQPQNSLEALMKIADSLREGTLPSDKQFQQLEEDAKK